MLEDDTREQEESKGLAVRRKSSWKIYGSSAAAELDQYLALLGVLGKSKSRA